MAVEDALRKLQAVVKAHRAALREVVAPDAASQEVLNAIDTLLEIEELGLDSKIDRLVSARRADTIAGELAALEPKRPRRRRWAH